ncbi:helix-turn-helix domain-containing protein [Streptomyces sp. NPDC002754]
MADRTEAERRRARYADKMRQRGTPLKVLPHEFEQAYAIVCKARDHGMDDAMIAQQCDLNPMGIYKIRTRRYTTMRRSTYEALMQVRPEPITSRRHPRKGKVPDGAVMDPAGTQRRLQALRAAGHTLQPLATFLEVTPEAVSDLCRSPRKGVYRTTYLEVKALYDKVADTDPADLGSTSEAIKRVKTLSARLRWAPPWCWDADTIDDPAAFPEWTGVCGTEAGAGVHDREGIPLCDPCQAAASYRRSSENLPVEDFDRLKFRATYKAYGYTAISLARAVGVSADSIYRWQAGDRNPRKPLLDKIADVLGVHPKELCVDDVHDQ